MVLMFHSLAQIGKLESPGWFLGTGNRKAEEALQQPFNYRPVFHFLDLSFWKINRDQQQKMNSFNWKKKD